LGLAIYILRPSRFQDLFEVLKYHFSLFWGWSFKQNFTVYPYYLILSWLTLLI